VTQFVEQQAGIPLLMRSISGNEVDSKAFNETFEGHIDQLKEELPLTYITSDAALYTKDNIQYLSPTITGLVVYPKASP